VLEARCGLQIGARDIYLNVAGGLRISEPAADLAVAAALVSALTLEPMPADTVVFGEIGLSGEVRPVGQAEARLKEAAKLGFSTAVTPARRASRPAPGKGSDVNGIALRELAHLRQLVAMFEDAAPRPARVLGPAAP
jgi:DNA repair protein RadA/Sms